MTQHEQYSKLKWLTAVIFFLYIGITIFMVVPKWEELSSADAFLISKHLALLLIIVVGLIVTPKSGSWFAFGWGAIVPLEKYILFVNEVFAGKLDSFAMLDAIRFLLIFIATCASAVLIYLFNFNQKQKIAEQS